MESLKAYSTILNNKQYRSPDEIELSKGLNEIIKDIEMEEFRLENKESLSNANDNVSNLGKTYENEQACEVCD